MTHISSSIRAASRRARRPLAVGVSMKVVTRASCQTGRHLPTPRAPVFAIAGILVLGLALRCDPMLPLDASRFLRAIPIELDGPSRLGRRQGVRRKMHDGVGKAGRGRNGRVQLAHASSCRLLAIRSGLADAADHRDGRLANRDAEEVFAVVESHTRSRLPTIGT